MQKSLSILLIDDNPNDRLLVIRELKREFPDINMKEIIDEKGFLQAIKQSDFDLVLTDYKLHWTDGIKILHEIKAKTPNCPVVMFTGSGSEGIAVEAMKEGLDDYVIKSPKEIKHLAITVKLALERIKQRQAMKATEKALKESEMSYRTLFEESRDAVYIITREGKFEDVNQSMLDICGYTREEMLKLDVLELYVHKEDRKKFQQEIEQNGSVRDFEVKFRRKDGTEIDCLLTSSVSRTGDGDVFGYQGILRDITENKRMEEQLKQYTQNLELMVEERTIELRESEELLKGILTGIGDFITIQNKDLDIIWVNKAIRENWGDVIGKKCYEVYKCLNEPCPECYVETVINEGKTVVLERVNILPNGQQMNVLITSSPMRDAEGNVAAVVELEKDITKLKQTENALRESEYTYRTLVEHLPQRIFIKDNNSVYLSCNDNYASDFNIKPNEITGKTDYDLFPNELAEKYRTDDKRVIESGKTEELEENYIIPDGKLRVVQTVKTPFKDEKDNIIGVLGIFWDISERKKLDKMKADFINLAAHELRTPLSAMKAHVELLKIKSERGYWNLPEEVHNKIKIIVRNADRLNVLISNLLDYTRLEAGTVRLKSELVSIEAETSDVITELLPSAQKHEHMLDFNVPKSLPPLYVDKEKFHSILRNVLSNAIKFTPDGGKINITVFEENDSFHIEVEDNGVGIKQEDLEKIFQPFQVAEIPSSVTFQSEFERTGLGLAITKQYLDMLSGKIWAESQIGEGSTFHILLPKKQNELE
ncbi:MAG: PAS domain S-box protein [Candidatus Sifarchaeia archaeon]|jgi:PAS domain S-box-containing protein